MSTAFEKRLASVGVRYRSAGGDYVDTVLGRAQLPELQSARPVREFRWYKGRTFYSGWYWSATTGAHVIYESRLELARILLADFDPAVSGIVAQPFQIRESVGEKVRRHVPDLLLSHSDGAVTVVDVKPARRMTDPLVREVFDWTSELVRMRGWRFEQWSGADPIELANVRFLAGYRRPFTVAAELCAPVLELVDGQLSIGGVENAAAEIAVPEMVRPVLLYLLWCGRLATDLSLPLSAGSPIWRVMKP
ncbi:TnsA-like heteromeric transposase endonuclease subunit [Actinoplanes hulinensis]|uniref:TnsA-like heteromeric transposase endonuclease subunit n=1 Tax=Actinoplanes hulinensis TaxID=1144547 RepID=A0ABS7B1M8_9ACTN|nr:TnsA-like heteromeric transposase endonuclease subunit [Actinoplanes hulinensis]MBW6434936.1 TnsA-like heteromeric transposase endonuclease subunit [Actinoplanes hulinensis]